MPSNSLDLGLETERRSFVSPCWTMQGRIFGRSIVHQMTCLKHRGLYALNTTSNLKNTIRLSREAKGFWWLCGVSILFKENASHGYLASRETRYPGHPERETQLQSWETRTISPRSPRPQYCIIPDVGSDSLPTSYPSRTPPPTVPGRP